MDGDIAEGVPVTPEDTDRSIWGDFTSADKRRLLDLSGGRCEHWITPEARCPKTFSEISEFEADHLIARNDALGRSGVTDPDRNGAAVCREHNRRKSDTPVLDWRLQKIWDSRVDLYAARRAAEQEEETRRNRK